MKDKHVFTAIGVVLILIIAVIVLGSELSKSQQNLKEAKGQNALTLSNGKLALTNVSSEVESEKDKG